MTDQLIENWQAFLFICVFIFGTNFHYIVNCNLIECESFDLIEPICVPVSKINVCYRMKTISNVQGVYLGSYLAFVSIVPFCIVFRHICFVYLKVKIVVRFVFLFIQFFLTLYLDSWCCLVIAQGDFDNFFFIFD